MNITIEQRRRKQINQAIVVAAHDRDIDSLVSLCKDEESFRHAMHSIQHTEKSKAYNVIDSRLQNFGFCMTAIERSQYKSIKSTVDKIDFLQTIVTKLYYSTKD